MRHITKGKKTSILYLVLILRVGTYLHTYTHDGIFYIIIIIYPGIRNDF